MNRRNFLAISMSSGLASAGRGPVQAAAPAGDYRGRAKEDLPTPALLVDLERLESNLRTMAEHCRRAGCGFRPHAKTHKCPEVARRQVAAGALGVCVATVPEAEAMVGAGIRGVLLTSPIVDRGKCARMAALVRRGEVLVAVGHPRQVELLDEAARAAEVVLPVLVDVDVGDRRTGVLPGEPALELGRLVVRARNLRLRGLQAYAGRASHVVGFERRRDVSRQAMQQALETRDLFTRHRLEVAILSGGSTGTYNIDSAARNVTELQVGSYVFMDVDYRRIGGSSNATVYDDFRPSLTVLATVISATHPDRVTVDAGTKALDTTVPSRPQPRDRQGLSYRPAGDEFGTLTAEAGARLPRLGERLELIVPHCDPTTNLYDRIFALRNNRVEAVWPVVARRDGESLIATGPVKEALMSRYYYFGIMLGLLVTASPCRAHFLFARITPQAEAGRFVEVYFSDRPDQGDSQFVDKIASTRLWVQSEPGQFQPLKTIKTADRLRALLPSARTLAVVGQCDYGVLGRPKQPAFLLRHFPKAITGDPQRLSALAPKKGLPLEIVCTIEGDRFHFTALRDGKPIPRAEFTLLGTSPKSTKLTAGEDGKATWKAVNGNFALYLGQTRKEAGEHDGKKYDEIRDFGSLAFAWPLEHTEADAAALKLFREALAARATWTKFPGFAADVEAYADGRTVRGTVTVNAAGEVTINTQEEVVSPWIQDRLDSIVLHRMAAPPSKSTPIVYFGDQDTSYPLGRLVVFEGGRMASSYRVKDRQLLGVNRHLGKMNMTITILENDLNAEGKVLPRSYTVQYWDAGTGQLKRTEAVQERWQRVDGLDVPVMLRVTEASEAGLSVKTLRLSHHKLLK